MPVQCVVAVLVVITLGRPILFRQPRPGVNGEIFTLVKFRTMRPAQRGEGVDSDAARLTRLGKFLRATSLDELPTLLNVIRGDMSLVGPRPLLESYLTRYTAEEMRRHEVKPGVTGLAQVSGRNSLSWTDKLALDVKYVETRSFALDLKILCRTVSRVISRSGVTADGHATMKEFRAGESEGDTQ
ncbi:Sugar transferase involved in LPS biosynthesis (colanic, teichoic acid) [Paramicrobacterium humi]|uniref:Sugar transferase involved in LPS biosynthesis (Colanic, teichoic acid) n=1 Tax=Paramicrobacterium humi TaxID=640635 RepID=A0A1H4NDB3_9MICO|nr:Sugar transferase involved in LPS biosynthesis (colanic, teichoic acid) [Microbacterium humi]